MTAQQHLRALGACADARQWAEQFDSWEEIIGKCDRPDWLLWLDEKLDILSDKERRLLAVHLVRSTPLADGRVVYDLLTDQRSRNALDVAERFAHGRATVKELDAAWDAAMAAARGAARGAAWDAAWGAAWGAARAAADAAWGAARAAAREYQSKHIRRKYGKRIIARLNKDYPVNK